MKQMLLGVVAALALLSGRAEAVTVGPGTYDIVGLTDVFITSFGISRGQPLTSSGVTPAPYDGLLNYTVDFLSGSVNGRSLSVSQSTQIGGNPCRSGCISPSVIFFPSDPHLTFGSSGRHLIINNGQVAGVDTFEVLLSIDLPAGVSLSPVPSLSAVPLPGALPLFATILGLGGLLGWRRSRRSLPPAVAVAA